MIDVLINPDGIDEEYLRCLNLCFGGWGDRRQFDWYFRREAACPRADLLVLKTEGRIAAGSGVTYRRAALPNEGRILVGVMTGSWTLPEYRGRGCFAKIISESAALAAGKGAALLLAFVTEENASSRQLARAGAALFPSFYISSTRETPRPRAAADLERAASRANLVSSMAERLEASRRGRARFVYRGAGEFGAQFLRRPSATQILRDARGNAGVVEERGETDVLQLQLAGGGEGGAAECVSAFLARALARGRKLFLYSTRPDVARASTRLGLAAKAGHLAALVADGRSLTSALGTGAPPPTARDSSALAREDGGYFLGGWDVQSGDRA